MAFPATTKTYSHEEILFIISTFHATPSDYLIQTYFQIYNITTGPLYDKYKRRFNNLIFNNFSEISKLLICKIFLPRTLELLHHNLSEVKYVSCIYPKSEEIAPVVIQYFSKTSGLEHRLLDYVTKPSGLSNLLGQYQLHDKLVGYCGDFCYRDPGNNNRSDYIHTLTILSGNKMVHLPYSDGFIDRFLKILLDYLPDDLINSLQSLGETVVGLSGNSEVAKTITQTYKKWLKSDQHILLSDYVDFIVEHYDAVNSYLLPLQCLPNCVVIFLSSVLQRFLLIVMREIYIEISRKKPEESNAVLYYFYLSGLQNTFKSYEDISYIPPKAWKYVNEEINSLVEKKQLEEMKVEKFFKQIPLLMNDTYIRAVRYLDPLVKEFAHFEMFTWVLLEKLPIVAEDVHTTYHFFKSTDCQNCDTLRQEVKLINSVIPKVPLVEIDTISSKWLMLSKQCNFEIVFDLLEILLSLPSICNIRGMQCHHEFGCTENIVRMNLKDLDVEKIEEFFGNRLEAAKDVIKAAQVSLLTD